MFQEGVRSRKQIREREEFEKKSVKYDLTEKEKKRVWERRMKEKRFHDGKAERHYLMLQGMRWDHIPIEWVGEKKGRQFLKQSIHTFKWWRWIFPVKQMILCWISSSHPSPTTSSTISCLFHSIPWVCEKNQMTIIWMRKELQCVSELQRVSELRVKNRSDPFFVTWGSKEIGNISNES